MDSKRLSDALRALSPEDFTWKLALYSASKSSDGVELEWNLLKMRGIANHIAKVTQHLLKKPVADKPVAPYSPFLSDKENIGALEASGELIGPQVFDILLSIKNAHALAPEDFLSGVAPRTTGYAFFGERLDEDGQTAEQVLFMHRGNPFLSGSASALLIGEGDEIAASTLPVAKLHASADFLLIDGACYFFSSAIEKDFALENRHIAIAQRRMADIAEAGIVSNYDRLEEAAMKAKNCRKFVDFDKQILEHIAGLSLPDREEFLATYGVTLDPSGRVDTADGEQCELVIDLLCLRSCLDPLGRLSVGTGITARET
jgi:hypothetical protein